MHTNFETRYNLQEEVGKYIQARLTLSSLMAKGQLEVEDYEKSVSILESRQTLLTKLADKYEQNKDLLSGFNIDELKKQTDLILGKLKENWS